MQILNSINQLFSRLATWRNAAVLIGVSIILQIYMIGSLLPLLLEFSGGIPNLDARLFYSPVEVDSLMLALGDEGRNVYFHMLSIDFLFPLMMGLGYAFLLSKLLQKTLSRKTDWHNLKWAPVFGMVFDYFENIGILMVLLSAPEPSGSWAWVMSGFTILKQTGYGLGGLGIVAALCLLLAQTTQNALSRPS